jgi:hypothetical protein
VIVPLRENRHLGIEGEHVLVEQIVFVVTAELGERLRGLGLFLGHVGGLAHDRERKKSAQACSLRAD